jgi:cobalt-zinc-cadmium efflux system outer membrane protein
MVLKCLSRVNLKKLKHPNTLTPKHKKRPYPHTPIRPYLFLILFLALIPALPAAAQEDDQLGVYEAVALARRQSPALNQLRQQVEAKGGQWWTSFGLSAPEVMYFKEGIADGQFAERRWLVSQTVDFPLQSYYRLRRVGTEQEALERDVESALNDLTVAVKKAYTELLYAQELIHLRQQEVRLAEALREAASVRVEVGEASELELMKAEIGQAEAQSNLEEAARLFQNARYALFNVIGLDPEEQRYSIQFPDTLVYLDVLIHEDRLLPRIDVQPELRSAAQNLAATRLGVKQTRSALLPALRFDWYVQDYGAGFEPFGFQIGLQVPLWLIPNHKGRMRAARADVQRASWKQQAVFLELKKQVEQTWHSYISIRQTIERYQDEVQGRADELLRLTQEGYRIGELDLLTLLDTQRTYLSSRLRYYDTLRAYYFHLIDLERYLGEDIVFNPAYAPAMNTME